MSAMLQACVALVISLLPLLASSCNRNNGRPLIFNFGDSNSDTGGLSAAIGFDIGYPYGRAFFHPPTGRASDGRLIIDFLCENVDANYLNPYLDSLEPDFRNGVNFAVSRASTLPQDIPFNLNIQLLQFKRLYKRSMQLHSKGVKKLFAKEDFKNALYTLDIGQNDLSGSFGALSYDQVIKRIPSFISQIKDAITLSNEGAEVLNTKLKQLCQQLRSQMDNSTIVYVDVYSIKYHLIAHSSSYGFANPLMACCGHGGAPYNFDSDATSCLGSGYTVCQEKIPYISWDGTHYTEAANAIFASKILSTRYSSPPLPFNFFCCTSNATIC